MKELLSDDLWTNLAERFPKHSRLRAAIAYVTEPHLRFADGDVLVCDASDKAITGGMTSALLLDEFLKAGAEIYSYDGLHAKLAVIDDFALLGSANMSKNAGIATCEASLLTDDAQIVGLALGFIENIKEDSIPITAEFVARIAALPVAARQEPIMRVKRRKLSGSNSRVWLISTRNLSDRLAEAEAKFDAAGMSVAEPKVRDANYEVQSMRWSGDSRFRREAKVGDLVMEVLTEKEEDGENIDVYFPAPILHRLDSEDGRWTRFYIEVPSDRPCYEWADIAADFASLGITKVSPNSTRELTGRALGILQLLE